MEGEPGPGNNNGNNAGEKNEVGCESQLVIFKLFNYCMVIFFVLCH